MQVHKQDAYIPALKGRGFTWIMIKQNDGWQYEIERIEVDGRTARHAAQEVIFKGGW